MEAIEIISNIFGEDVVLLHQLLSVYDMPNKSRTAVYLRTISQWLEDALNNMKMDTDENIHFCDKREGRLGPSHVCFDVASHVGLFVLGSDRLSVNSQGNFSTIRANVCLYKGKWQYEVQLGSKGVMQIGWATNNCRFTQETGVGDTLHSYAYDGNRVRKWNVSTYKYGEPWLSGDIIGCTIDLDRGAVAFHRNGHTMGEAFSDVKLGPGMVYFPAVSLAFTENLVANFGSTPFRYPVEGYQPIQEVPHHDLDKANMLFKWLLQLLMVFEQSYENSTRNIEDVTSNQALLMGLAGVLIDPLAPLLLSSYISEACLLPFLELLCGVPADYMQPEGNTREKKHKFLIFMDLLWAFLEEHEIKQCLESIASCLLACYRHVSFDLDYASQKRSLVMLTHLVSHPRTRHYLLENVLFDKVRFANFVHVKPMDEGGLAQVVTNPWWETDVVDDDVERNKEDYLQACQKIKEAAASVEAVQINFLGKLLDNADGTETQPSSRKIFLKKFRVFLHENLISSQTLPLLQTPLPVSLCCFHRLLVTFRILWSHEIGQGNVYIPSTIFYDGSINYFSIDRLGGVLSHLNKTLRADLSRVLGEEHRVVASIPLVAPERAGATAVAGRSSAPLQSRFSEGNSPFMIPALARLITHQQTASGPALTDRMPVLFTREQESLNVSRGNGNANPMESLIELLDGLVLFYHLGAHKQIVKVSTLRENMSEYVIALNDTNFRLASYSSHLNEAASCSTEDEVVRELLNSRQVFETKLMEQARHMAWVRGAVYSPEKQGHLVWFLRILLQSLKKASGEGNLFSFVPDFYLETVVEVCTALRSYLHPTAPLEQVEGSEELLKDVAEFLCNHFADPRIVNAGSKDTLIQALASFVSQSHTLQCLELVPESSQVKMVKSLLRPYENRAWAQSNWVLLRLWHGCGFAFRYQKSPHLIRKIGPKMLPSDTGLISQTMKPCPSMVFQRCLRNVMLSEEQTSVAFLNSLLNQLNWVFSEFIGMLQEIQNLSNRPQRVYIESRQLKICATHFDLALSLLRVLEMVASVAREIFSNTESESSESLLSRLCQLLCQVLNRISSPAGCFQHVVILEIPDLETIDHFPILAAVIGILLALLEADMINFSDKGEAVPKVSKCLLSEPSFQMSSLHFVLGNAEKSRQKLDPKPFSFRNYPEAVTEEEISHVVYMIRMLESYQRRISEVKIASEDDLCTICYAFPISATFKPCNHQSCRSCIAHHLMNAKDCFFCKTPIQTVIGPDGQILHDCTTEVD
uniref:RING-type E3 ubiquitin transferase n=1 Tax=Schistocerca gregaria TaxID=7010 RepID=A0A8E5JT09_SCHGR|nr:E3 ubuquitin-protein kinase RNF123 [Schistocerca gregaria]